jgi:hypothetical protein
VLRDKGGIGEEEKGNGRTVIDADPKPRSTAADD